MAKLNLRPKEVGRLTLTIFNKLYSHYKNNWDIEMRMTKNNITYSELQRKSLEDEEWL